MYSGGLVAAHGAIVKKLEQLGTPLLPKGEQNSTQLLWVPMRGVVGTSVTLMLTAEVTVLWPKTRASSDKMNNAAPFLGRTICHVRLSGRHTIGLEGLL